MASTFFQDNLNNIVNDDCINVLSKIPNESVDVVFADPPFNLKKKYNSTNDNLSDSEYMVWTEKWIKECVRILKPGGSIFVHNIPKWLVRCTPILEEVSHFKHWISWDAPTSPMGKSLQPAHYGILFYTKTPTGNKFREIRHPHKRCRKKKCNHLLKDYGGKKDSVHPFGPLVSDVWTEIHRIKHNKFRDEHPCQLPIHLLERIILMSTDEGDVVFDPFMGTGTTALAAKRLGRRFIGAEKDPKYHEAALSKLEKEDFVSQVAGAWVSIYRNEVRTLRTKDWDILQEHYSIPENRKEVDFTTIKLK